MDLGENKVLFEISRGGEIRSDPQNWTVSTSHEMQGILDEIVRQVANYFGYLLQKKLRAK